MGDFVVLIPAYNPDDKLVDLVEALARTRYRVVVLNDGSSPESAPVFQKIRQSGQAEILQHAVNLGKGAALKTGLNHIAVAFPEAAGVVCADADGQHSVQDILKTGASLDAHPNALGIGVRTFHADIPLRSRIGNLLTKRLFNFFTGLDVSDTQTGLRAIPMSFIPHCLRIRSNRYEYELEMLLLTKSHHTPIVQIPIETIYIEDNKSSHFNVFKDSVRIYFVLFRFVFSSILAAVLDYAIFMAVYSLSTNLLASQYIARAGSGAFNFTLNRKLVFSSRGGLLGSLSKYVILAVFLAFCSYVLITYLAWLGVPVALAKPLAEGALFIASFSVQRSIVFASSFGQEENDTANGETHD
jgi:glycosyltransferase involved in cell wall biosynthesis